MTKLATTICTLWLTTLLSAGCADGDEAPQTGPANEGGSAGERDANVAGPNNDAAMNGEQKSDSAISTDLDASAPKSAESQTPPQGGKAVRAWLAAGHYKSWKCEGSIMKARPNGAHGRNRVCSNDLASAHGAGPYPVGAASVKEIYGAGNAISEYAVALKVKPGTTADTWYWFEGSYDGVAVPLCSGCHSRAAEYQGHDYVYVQVR